MGSEECCKGHVSVALNINHPQGYGASQQLNLAVGHETSSQESLPVTYKKALFFLLLFPIPLRRWESEMVNSSLLLSLALTEKNEPHTLCLCFHVKQCTHCQYIDRLNSIWFIATASDNNNTKNQGTFPSSLMLNIFASSQKVCLEFIVSYCCCC